MKREQEIQSEIIEWLKSHGVLVWKCNLGGIRFAGRGMGKNPMKGFPDLGACHDGRLIAIEVKRYDGRMSPEQLEWKRRLEKAGAIVIVATSIESVRRHFEEEAS